MTSTVKISALPAGTTPTGSEAFPAVQSAATVKLTLAQVQTYLAAAFDALGAAAAALASAEAFSANAANVTSGQMSQARIASGIIRELGADGVSLASTGDIATITVPVARYSVGASRILNCTGSPGTAEIQIWTGPGGTGTKVADFTSFSTATGTTIVNGTNSAAVVSTAGTLYVRVVATGTGAADVNLQIIDLT